jgi:hypothetical protein
VHRLLLLCIAAFQDAGHAPSVAELGKMLGVPGTPNQRARIIDALLAALEDAGHLTVDRMWPARNRYTMHLEPEVRTRGSRRRSR